MIDEYVWKKGKSIIDKKSFKQESVKMIEMSEVELQEAYTHCNNMLTNDSKTSPGRFLVLAEITKQIAFCSAELAVRWFCQITNADNVVVYSKISLVNEINDFLEANKNNYSSSSELRLKDIYNGLPADYANISIDLFLKACKDTLGKFNKSHLTQSFIINLGLWFTPEEAKNFTQVEKLTTLEQRLQVIKERLNLNKDIKIPVKSTGLSYTQFRSMINLKFNKKYTELTTNQLETLRNKVLFALEENVKYHIKQWTTLKSQLMEVAKINNFKLV